MLEIYSGCMGCSYYYLSVLYEQYFRKYGIESKYIGTLVRPTNSKKFLIDDILHGAYELTRQRRKVDFFRGDSVLYPWYDFHVDSILIVPSNWNAEQYSKYFRKTYVLPHFVNDDVIEMVVRNEEKLKEEKLRNIQYSFLTIGHNNDFDRKGIVLAKRLMDRLGISNKLVCYSNEPFCKKEHRLTEVGKYREYYRARFYVSLSYSESFGMTPFEAMAVGTPVIYPNCHAYAEYFKGEVGLPINCQGHSVVKIADKDYNIWYFDIDEAKEIIQYADSMTDEEYVDMSIKTYEFAQQFYARNVVPKLVEILKSQ
jgi:glycosyltransferase involved in cell wall biosynthesis